MTTEDKERIEKEAEEYVKRQGSHSNPEITKHDYIAGATQEHERMGEQLKQERNKAIDELYEMLLEHVDVGYLDCRLETLNERIKALKH